jgi:phospholipid/cholesterol/gamma-HCH transport system substrate-binding protein
MKNKANFTVVGVFVLLSFLLMVGIAFWLSSTGKNKHYYSYVVYVDEPVTGLAENSVVRFNGVPVGFVDKISLDQHNPLLVVLHLKVESQAPVTTTTYASLHMWGITGTLELGLTATKKGGRKLEPTASISTPSIPFRASLFVQLSSVVPTISKNLLQMTASVNALLNEKNRRSISESLANINQFTKTLSASSKTLNASIKNLNKTLIASAKASESLPSTMKQLNVLLTAANKTANDLQAASKSVGSTAKDGSVVMRNFSQQMMPSMQQSIMQLNRVMANIRRLTAKLNRNPSVLVRGQQPKQPGPGE